MPRSTAFSVAMVCGALLSACSFPAVFLREASDDARSTDASLDSGMDSGMDAGAEAGRDATSEPIDDVASDIASERATDSAPDALGDVVSDAGFDAASDAASDAAREASAPDAAPDASDASCSMVLDAGPAPRVAWGRNWGGAGANASTGSGAKGEITSDDRSNVYVVSTYGSGIEVAGTPYVTNRFGGLVIKYDAMGTRQWVRNFNTPGTGDFIPVRLFWDRVRDEVVVLANGFGGEARVDATRVGTRALSSSAVVVRLEASTGNVVGGGYVFGSSQWDSLALGRTASGNILIGGAFFSDLTLPNGTVVSPIAPGTADALIVEWNYVTNTVVRHFVVGGAGNESVFAVAELPDGDIVLGGRYSSAVPTVVGGIAVSATIGDDAMIARIAPTGAVRSFRVLRGPGNGPLVNELQVGPSGDYYLSGYYDGSIEYDAMTPRTLSGSSSGSFVARVRAADNDWAWFVGQTGGGGTIEGVRRFSIDACERVHVAFSTSARDSFTEFAGVSLSPSGTAVPPVHTFIGVMRGGDGSLVRLDRLGPVASGSFGVQAMTLLPDGRHAIKGDLSGTMTVDGTTFTTPDNMVDQFAATLSF